MRDYTFVKFQKSNTQNKKYDAIIKNNKTGDNITIPFGDNRYEQYNDSTGLGIYSSLNHNDKQRRMLYRKRHETYLKPTMFSAGYFSWHYLW